MIPRTFPSVEVDGVRAMYVRVLDSVVGLQQWIDYIPVKSTDDPGVNLNTYNGSFLASVYPEVGGQAWKDYIPVYLVDYPDVKAWRSDNDGFIPLYGVAGWTPAKLFLNGEQGAWYDPSDLTTLYQDSAGTTAVTAVEQPVGLMLDKSKGLVLGSELVTNGAFTTDTDWTKSTGWTISGGLANASAATSALSQAISTSQGKYYVVTFTVSNYVSGRVRFQTLSTASEWRSANGTYTLYFLQTAASQTTGIVYADAFTGSVDNISVRELPGNHAFNPNATTVRPTLSARYNLFQRSEEFDNAVWFKTRSSVSGASIDAIAAPDGTMTADKLVEDNSASSTHLMTQSVTTLAVPYEFSVDAKAGERNFIRIANASVANAAAFFDLSSGAVGSIGADATATIQAAGNGWYRCSITFTATAASNVLSIAVADADTGNGLSRSYTGDGTSGIYIWGADLRVANESATIPYQRVVTATDYDADPTKFPYYLRFDGSDDWLQTASIDFTATDKMSVFAGVRKLSDAAQFAAICELSSAWIDNTGTFALWSQAQGGQYYESGSRGTAVAAVNQNATSAIFAAPVTNVVTASHDISAPLSALRVNGAASGTDGTGNKGSGNFGNYPLYIGRRGGTSLPFNGRLYSLIIRGALTDAATIALAEDYVETKTFGKNMNIVYVDNVLIDGDQVQIDGEDVYVTSRYE